MLNQYNEVNQLVIVYFVRKMLFSAAWRIIPQKQKTSQLSRSTDLNYQVKLIKKWAILGIFFGFFSSFQTSLTILTANICEKMSIQYMVPGFKPMTFGTRVSSDTTRPVLQPITR